MTKPATKKPLDFYFFLALFAIDFVFIALAINFYPEDFPITYPLSYSSMVLSYELQLDNSTSALIYSIGMILSALVMLTFAVYKYRIKNHNGINGVLLPIVGAFGFLIAAFSPDDTRHTFHVIGSSLFVATLWILATSYLFSVKKYFSRRKYDFLQFILQIPIFAYAIAYFLALGILPNVLQKFAFLGLAVSLLSASRGFTNHSKSSSAT